MLAFPRISYYVSRKDFLSVSFFRFLIFGVSLSPDFRAWFVYVFGRWFPFLCKLDTIFLDMFNIKSKKHAQYQNYFEQLFSITISKSLWRSACCAEMAYQVVLNQELQDSLQLPCHPPPLGVASGICLATSGCSPTPPRAGSCQCKFMNYKFVFWKLNFQKMISVT